MTVALATDTDGPGGAEWTVIHLATGLRDKGHRVFVILPENGVGWLGGHLTARGVETRSFRLDHPFDAGCVLRLRRLLREEEAGVVHSHEFTMAVFGTAAAWLAGVPAVATFHSAQGFTERARRRVATRWAIRKARAATTVSRATLAEIGDRLSIDTRDWHVIPNGVPVPLGDRDLARKDLGIAPDCRLLLAVGNLYPVKGHDVLIRALARLPKDEGLPHWQAAVAGRGEQLASLTRMTDELGLTSRVQFLGYREDVGSLLHAADVFVQPSRSEGLPLSVIEAMSVGVPVIASRVGGLPEVVQDGETGLLVPPEDPDALAGAILSLLIDDREAGRIGAAGRTAASAKFGIDSMVVQYERLYRASTVAR